MKNFIHKLHNQTEQALCEEEKNTPKANELSALLDEVRFALYVVEATKPPERVSPEIVEEIALLAHTYEALTNKTIE